MRHRFIGLLNVAATILLSELRATAGTHAESQAIAPAAFPVQQAADFFVSPHGNDTWSGRRADPGENDGPFATVVRAHDAVRALHNAQKEPRPVRVMLRGGTYFLDSTLEFGPEDSGVEQAPVVYARAPGETVVLSGGRRLATAQQGEVNGRKAWLVNIPEVKAGAWRFRQLFVNGERRPSAARTAHCLPTAAMTSPSRTTSSPSIAARK